MDRQTIHDERAGLRWQLFAVVFCTLFGLAHLLNVFTVGDGLWYWYGALVRDGRHMYSDLHLNLQPLFVLLTRYALSLFGPSWLGFRIFPAIQVVLYSVGLMLVARFVPWRDRHRAVLILAAFGMTMTIDYYRFDDFHVTTQILQVYSLWFLLLLDKEPTPKRALLISVVIGILSGMSIGNRLNDGVALFGACAVALFGSAFRNRILSTLLFCVTALCTFTVVVLLTGDSFPEWFRYSVVQAAQIKSGSGHIWTYPLLLPFRTTWGFLKNPHAFLPLVYLSSVAACVVWLPGLCRRTRGRLRQAIAILGTLYFIAVVLLFLKNVLLGDVNPTVANAAVPVAYVLFLVIAFRFLRHLRSQDQVSGWHARELLLLVPMLQLFLAAITAGSGETECTPAMALTLLLLPIVTPVPFPPRLRRMLALVAALIAVAAFPVKYLLPFQWHDYVSDTMFTDRTWYRHPVFGPMYMESRHLAMIEPVCRAVALDQGSLLSLPYPHANYFCNVPPWKGYVQTWYDTSSKQTIDYLADELRTTPPKWIYYERSLGNMEAHEIVYNGGRPLAHRQLDNLLMGRVAAGLWTVVHQECFAGADWLLVRTSPARPGEAADYPVIMTKHANMCERTWQTQ